MKVKLSEIYELQMGKTPSRNSPKYWSNGVYPWMSIADLSTYKKYVTSTKEAISEIAVKESGIKVVPENTVIMSFKLSIGKTAITAQPIYTNEAIMAFIPTGKYEVLPEFAYYLFCSKDWTNGSNKAVMGITLNKATLREIEIDIPCVNKQKEAIKKLNVICDLIFSRKQQLAKLDELVKSRFIELFGDCKKTVRLSEVASVTGGLTKNSKRDKLAFHMPYLRVANVFFDCIDTTEILDIGLTEDERDKTLLKYGDLLFVEGNGSPEQIGRVAVWHDEIKDCVHQNHLIKARLDEKRILPCFALHYYMSQEGRKQIKEKAVSTSGLYTLSVSKISELMLPCPTMGVQEQFAAFVEQTDKSKLAVQKSLEKLEILKKSLMQQYFG